MLVGAINQEKALVSRGILRDCEIFANLSFEALSGGHRGGGEDGAEDPEHLDPETGHNCFI